MAKRKIPKIQHYVPQFILRNFCIGNTAQLLVFDKLKERIFLTNIRNVAAEKGFYDLDIRGISTTMEFGLSELEGKSSPIINKIINDGSLVNITDSEKELLSYFFATQLTRVKNVRYRYKQINDLLADKVKEMGFDPKNIPDLNHDENDFKSMSILGLGDMVSEFAPYFYNKDWVLFKAPSDTTYYISDNPVTLQNLIDYGPRGNLGLAVKGIEIYFPLSKHYSLGMICRSYQEIIDENFKKIDFLKKYGFNPNLDIDQGKIEDLRNYTLCIDTGAI
jgi:hypothetical protein